jgi:hypothetical protein
MELILPLLLLDGVMKKYYNNSYGNILIHLIQKPNRVYV